LATNMLLEAGCDPTIPTFNIKEREDTGNFCYNVFGTGSLVRHIPFPLCMP